MSANCEKLMSSRMCTAQLSSDSDSSDCDGTESDAGKLPFQLGEPITYLSNLWQ